ncbi:MAG: hypothetical protein QGG54_06905 [Gammaproteobacteria bacterium]|nr:hypothetical protein [Gammaproteobacteria bacterium]MDP6674935.1 hypothetical protein [Gammaproteobacteria bacterium]
MTGNKIGSRRRIEIALATNIDIREATAQIDHIGRVDWYASSAKPSRKLNQVGQQVYL